MKSFLFTSDRDPVNSAARGDVTVSQRRLLMDLRSREPGFAQNVRLHRAINFACFAVIGPGLLQSAEAGSHCGNTAPRESEEPREVREEATFEERLDERVRKNACHARRAELLHVRQRLE
jgi:hypothetical protein